MDKENKLTKQDYLFWKDLAFTKKLLQSLANLRKAMTDNVLNESIIMGNDCQINFARLLGKLEGIDLVLEMCADDDDSIQEDAVDNITVFHDVEEKDTNG